MKENLHLISTIFFILTLILWVGTTFTIGLSNNAAEIDLTLQMASVIIGVFGMGLYNLFTMDSKGSYKQLKEMQVKQCIVIKNMG